MCKGINGDIERLSVKEKLSLICMRIKMKPESVLGVCCSVVVLVVAAVVFPAAQVNERKFHDTFMERCLAYPEQQQICERAWTAFEQAYVGKDDRDVSAESYRNLFTQIPFTHAGDRTMFSSGLKDMDQDLKKLMKDFFVKNNYFIKLGNTLLGSVLDKLTWCGKKNSTETFTDCKTSKKAVDSFWDMASIKFAEHASGEATVVLYGDAAMPFNPEKVFGKYEVPNLQQGTVTQLTIVLITRSNRNQCKNKSVKKLENMVKSQGISSACKEVTKSRIEECIQNEIYQSCW